MEIYNSLEEYKMADKSQKLFGKTGMFVMKKYFHDGISDILMRMKGKTDYQIVVVAEEQLLSVEKRKILDYLNPFNIDCVIFVDKKLELKKENDNGLLELIFKVNMEETYENGSFDGGKYIELMRFYLKLFYLINPKFVYFGQKSFILAKLILELIEILGIECEVQVLPSVRMENGSLFVDREILRRNGISEDLVVLSRALEFIERMINNGIRDTDKLRIMTKEFLGEFARFSLIRLDFLSAINLKKADFLEKERQFLIEIEGILDKIIFRDNIIV